MPIFFSGPEGIMALVVGILLPVMLIYNGYQYRVFRGKTMGSYGE
jgi:cytochrome bd-type quinol oxidase subunit 2